VSACPAALTRVYEKDFALPADQLDFSAFEALLLKHAGLRSHLKERTVRAGEHVIKQGDVCTDIFVLRAGLVKMYYVTREGKEWVKSFIMDRGVFGSRIAQMAGEGSAFAIVCVEDSTLVTLPYSAFLEASLRDATLMEMVFRFNEWLGLKKERREYDLLCRSAEERYRTFVARDAQLAGRLTQVDIARYLGITPIALSRIKRRVAARTTTALPLEAAGA
jgi:CRP-like cAMP-binding protein